jgi:hypothetical protein
MTVVATIGQDGDKTLPRSPAESIRFPRLNPPKVVQTAVLTAPLATRATTAGALGERRGPEASAPTEAGKGGLRATVVGIGGMLAGAPLLWLGSGIGGTAFELGLGALAFGGGLGLVAVGVGLLWYATYRRSSGS